MGCTDAQHSANRKTKKAVDKPSGANFATVGCQTDYELVDKYVMAKAEYYRKLLAKSTKIGSQITRKMTKSHH